MKAFTILYIILTGSILFFTGVKTTFSQSADSLHLQVEELIYNDPEAALELALQEIEITKKGTIAYVDGLNDAGKASYYMDEYVDGKKYLEDALNEATVINYESGKATALFSLGDLYILEGKYGTAIDYLGDGLALFQKIKDDVGTADCLNGIGIIH
ncbi:MAG: tetratricopeptide repeat protein, partial [Bacteroidota bacterium]